MLRGGGESGARKEGRDVANKSRHTADKVEGKWQMKRATGVGRERRE